MPEYITKEQVRDILARHYPYANLREETAMFHVNKDIKALPAADVVEVVHGEWLRYGEDGYPNMIDTVSWQCDQCLETYWGRTTRIPNYCPSCGAKMGKDDVDNG